MMQYHTPTMRVRTDAEDNEQGYYLINREDFNPEEHEPFDEIEPGSPEAQKLEQRLTQELEDDGEDESAPTPAPSKPNKKK